MTFFGKKGMKNMGKLLNLDFWIMYLFQLRTEVQLK